MTVLQPIRMDQAPAVWLLIGEATGAPEGDVWTIIERRLRQDPDLACLQCNGAELTRRDVIAAVNAIPWRAEYRRVGVCMRRSTASVIVTLAIWRNGAVYVPIAFDHPIVKIEAIAKNCALDLVITDRALDLPGYDMASRTPCGTAELIFYGRGTIETAVSRDDDGVCLIAHTSGSSGDPKGVKVSHRGVLNRIVSMQRLLSTSSADRFIYKTSVLFDVHVWEIVLPLASGCYLNIHYQSELSGLNEVARLIRDGGVTIVGFVPTLLQILLEVQAFRDSRSLRAVLCGGEAWRPHLAEAFFRNMPGRALYNSYGPTETTIAVSNWKVPAELGRAPVALGQPLENITFIIEADLERATAGGNEVIGALSVAGPQVALGYVQDQRPSRFSARMIQGKMTQAYQTGDIVRLDLRTGLVYFHGREDNQVKVNGTRIELDEVQEAVNMIDAVDCSVALLSDEEPPQLWVAYTAKRNRVIDTELVRAACRARLSGSCLPTRYQQVAEFPVLGSGKIDRRTLTQRLIEAAAFRPEQCVAS